MTEQEFQRSLRNLKRAIRCFENQSAMARKMKITSQAITNWKAGRAKIPIVQACEIARITKNKVSAYDLRPDIKFLKKITLNF